MTGEVNPFDFLEQLVIETLASQAAVAFGSSQGSPTPSGAVLHWPSAESQRPGEQGVPGQARRATSHAPAPSQAPPVVQRSPSVQGVPGAFGG